MRSHAIAAAVAAVLLAPATASAATAYNSTPADTFFFGTGNNSTGDTAVFTSGAGDQLYIRFKPYQQPSPGSADGTYRFALGTDVSYDFGIDTSGSFPTGTGTRPAGVTALLTITNVGTGASASYDPYIFLDNAYQSGSLQNSERLGFGFLNGGFIFGNVGYNPNVDSTYRLNLTVGGLTGGTQSFSADAQLGAGAAAAPGVPEPATWGLMLAGFGLVGGAARRRRTTVAFA